MWPHGKYTYHSPFHRGRDTLPKPAGQGDELKSYPPVKAKPRSVSASPRGSVSSIDSDQSPRASKKGRRRFIARAETVDAVPGYNLERPPRSSSPTRRQKPPQINTDMPYPSGSLPHSLNRPPGQDQSPFPSPKSSSMSRYSRSMTYHPGHPIGQGHSVPSGDSFGRSFTSDQGLNQPPLSPTRRHFVIEPQRKQNYPETRRDSTNSVGSDRGGVIAHTGGQDTFTRTQSLKDTSASSAWVRPKRPDFSQPQYGASSPKDSGHSAFSMPYGAGTAPAAFFTRKTEIIKSEAQRGSEASSGRTWVYGSEASSIDKTPPSMGRTRALGEESPSIAAVTRQGVRREGRMGRRERGGLDANIPSAGGPPSSASGLSNTFGITPQGNQDVHPWGTADAAVSGRVPQEGVPQMAVVHGDGRRLKSKASVMRAHTTDVAGIISGRRNSQEPPTPEPPWRRAAREQREKKTAKTQDESLSPGIQSDKKTIASGRLMSPEPAIVTEVTPATYALHSLCARRGSAPGSGSGKLPADTTLTREERMEQYKATRRKELAERYGPLDVQSKDKTKFVKSASAQKAPVFDDSKGMKPSASYLDRETKVTGSEPASAVSLSSPVNTPATTSSITSLVTSHSTGLVSQTSAPVSQPTAKSSSAHPPNASHPADTYPTSLVNKPGKPKPEPLVLQPLRTSPPPTLSPKLKSTPPVSIPLTTGSFTSGSITSSTAKYVSSGANLIPNTTTEATNSVTTKVSTASVLPVTSSISKIPTPVSVATSVSVMPTAKSLVTSESVVTSPVSKLPTPVSVATSISVMSTAKPPVTSQSVVTSSATSLPTSSFIGTQPITTSVTTPLVPTQESVAVSTSQLSSKIEAHPHRPGKLKSASAKEPKKKTPPSDTSVMEAAIIRNIEERRKKFKLNRADSFNRAESPIKDQYPLPKDSVIKRNRQRARGDSSSGSEKEMPDGRSPKISPNVSRKNKKHPSSESSNASLEFGNFLVPRRSRGRCRYKKTLTTRR